MRRLLVILLALVPLLACPQGEGQASGHVTGPDGQAIAGAMVKLMSEGKTRVFTRTDKAGKWTLKVPAASEPLILKVEHLSYGSIDMPLPAKRSNIEVRLTSIRQLREVVVKAKPVTVRGDTVSFNLDMLRDKNDVTLEESLKKVPGITVQDNGTINYLDKPISNFYIEGLDLTGGKYALATRNLPAEYVKSVEVLHRHHDIKKDKGRYSDKVALNVRLKEKVKFKPVGTTEAAAGYGDGKVRYFAGGTGMLFTPSLQVMANAKYGNINEFASYENREIIVTGVSPASRSVASRTMGRLGTSTPPLRSIRYTDPVDLLTNINAIRKIGKDATLKAEASYARTSATTAASQTTTYFTGGEPLSVSERMTPHTTVHKPTFELTYKLNSDELFQQNSFRFGAEILRCEMGTASGRLNMDQRQRGHSISLSDVFNHTRNSDKLEWHFTTKVSYTMTPTMRIWATGGESADFMQRSSSDNIVATQTVQTAFYAGAVEIGVPISVNYDYTALSTDLSAGSKYDGSSNRVYYNSLRAGVGLWGNYKTPDGLWYMDASLPVEMRVIDGHNSRSGTEMKYARPQISPSVRLTWQMTPTSDLSVNSSLSHSTGDALDLLTEAVQSSWRNIRVRSGELARSTSWSSRLGYGLKLPFDMFFASANAGYSMTRSNLLGTQNVGSGEDITGSIARDHTSRRLNGGFNVSKTFQDIRTKVSLIADGGTGRNEIIQQNIAVNYRSSNVSIVPAVNLRPMRWAAAEVKCNMARTWSSYEGRSSHLNSMSLYGRLSLNLVKNTELRLTLDHVAYQLPDMNYKKMSLGDVALIVKLGRSQLTLGVENVLNTRRFDYTIFSQLDTRSYSYDLRGRTAIVTFRLTR